MAVLVLRLLPGQIANINVWETIKFAVIKTSEIKDDDISEYLNELLNALLNEKAQCWIRLDDDRTLDSIAITRLLVNKLSNKKELHIQALYSFKIGREDIWRKALILFLEYAKKENCICISCDSKNEKIWELASGLGFKEEYRHFSYEVMN